MTNCRAKSVCDTAGKRGKLKKKAQHHSAAPSLKLLSGFIINTLASNLL